MSKLYTLGEFHKLAKSTRDKECRKRLLFMHKQFQCQHVCGVASTPLLPMNVRHMFARNTKMVLDGVRDVRTIASLFAFVKWYGRNRVVRKLSKKELGHWLVLCVNTLVHIQGFSRDGDDGSERRAATCAWFLAHVRGDTSRCSHRTQLSLHYTVSRGRAATAATTTTSQGTFDEVVEFLDSVVGTREHSAPFWFDTSLSFREAPRVRALCEWSRALVRSLLGDTTNLLLVVLFSRHVQVFRDPEAEKRTTTVAVVVRSKTDDTPNDAIVEMLHSHELMSTDKELFFFNVTLRKDRGLYVA
ncbi:MAG: hypothetical protein CMI16_07270 [Opitutaceae bacterium]|nr:hypothetical protein [Opitutaceae bacterium]|tara:strand:+ start:550 stop:1452 length:903 start_codon:yes stop_codon:yes gene_type:complete